MIFWLAVLGSVFAGIWATKIGFYETLVHTFNACLSIYIAVFLTPYVVTKIPAAADIVSGLSLTLIFLAVICFLFFYGISCILFTGQFKIRFPQILDKIFSGLLGCLAGFILTSFVFVSISFTAHPLINSVLNLDNLKTNTAAICCCCDKINRFIGTSGSSLVTQDVFTWLVNKNKSNSGAIRPDTDPNKPYLESGSE